MLLIYNFIRKVRNKFYRQLKLNNLMGNKLNTHIKNFQMSPIDFSPQVNSKPMRISHLNNVDQLFPQNVNKNHKYKTISLKTKKEISFDQLHFKAEITSLKILTYNIWFESFNVQNRIPALLKIIKQSNADIICLQQVTSQFTKHIWDNAVYLCQRNELFMPIIPMHWYDVVIITRYPIIFYQIPFHSDMDRKLLMGICELTDKNNEKYSFSINCVHLQSLNSTVLRKIQLSQIKEMNQKIDIVCVVGDFNFTDNNIETKIIQEEYLDVWNLCHDEKYSRWTMPKTYQFPEWRPDHVIIKNNKLQNNNFSKTIKAKIQRMGVFTISPFQSDKVEDILMDGQVRTPSDHMGLLANIRF